MNNYYNQKEMRDYDPQFVIDFYESKLQFVWLILIFIILINQIKTSENS